MTTPFPFTSGQTLTAAQMNAITTLPINDETASYTLVVGDVGNRVIMNVASANTVTVNNNVFGASDQVQIINKGAGTTTITAGAGVTINSASGLTLVQYQSGTLIALSASTFLFVKEDVTVSAGGLVLITAGTYTTATSISLPNNTFSSTYRNYKIMFTNTAQTGSVALTMRLRASGSDNTTSNYFQAAPGLSSTVVAKDTGNNGSTSYTIGTTYASATFGQVAIVLDVIDPQQTQYTFMAGHTMFFNTDGHLETHAIGTIFNGNTSFDSLSLISSVASSITGIYRVYGYADS